MAEPRKLKPATPSTPEAAAYMPRIPWRWIVLGTTFFATVVTGYTLKEKNKADTLRQQILSVHEEQLEPAKKRYREFRDKIEGLVLQAGAEAEPKTIIDPRLNLGGLRAGRGLYLRVPKDQAADEAKLEASARAMDSDAITKCMGLTAVSARGLYEQGAFLENDWAEETREQEGVMELRVADEVLARHIKADLPSVLGLLRSNWFLLVLQTGDNRRDAPVDVYLWDLATTDLLLRTRIQARGALLKAHILSEGAPRGALELGNDGASHDCSIAAQLLALDGAKLTEIQNAQPAGDAGSPQDKTQTPTTSKKP